MTELEADDVVDIAQNGLPHRLKFEHSRGRIYETDVDIQRGLHRRFRLQSTRRRRTAHTLLDALGGRARGNGPVVEVASHQDPQKHENDTYHLVYFNSGGQGIYPESCLVPMPSKTLGSD